MIKERGRVALFVVCVVFGPGCEVIDPSVGVTVAELTKCTDPTRNGDSNFCANPACPCEWGEGDCDFDSECSSMPDGGTPLVCVNGLGLQFGLAQPVGVCAPAHCGNNVRDGDETQIDCGGSCGANCGDPCAGLPASPLDGHCTTDCPCPALEADCNLDTQCDTGLVCRHNEGTLYGFGSGVDVCVGAHCFNAALDGNETGTDCGGSCRACSASEVGTETWGGTGIDRGLAVAVDSNGNIIVAGRFTGTANFGGTDLVSAGFADVFVAKYDSTGNHLWSLRWGGANADGDSGVAVAVDAANNVVVGGNFYLTVDFGGGALASADGTDMFLVRLDPNGNHLWSRRFGGTGIDRVAGVATDLQNNIVLTGSFENSISFGGATLTSASPGLYDVALARFNSSGTHLWSRRYGGTGADQAYGVAIDGSKGPTVVGAFTGTVNFGGGDLVSAGQTDAFVLRVTSSGGFSWANRYGGGTTDAGTAVAFDGSNRPVVIGTFRGTVNFGGTDLVSAGATDGFILGLETTGAHRWSGRFGGSTFDGVRSVVSDSSGNVAVVGIFQGSVDFGSGSVTSAGSNDMFLLRYSSAGAFSSVVTYGSSGSDSAESVALRSGVLAITGWFDGSIDFGSGTVTPLGGADVFVARRGF